MKQFDLFGNEIIEDDGKYTKKIELPLYEPKNTKPHVLELSDRSKARRLINKIRNSNVSEEEKTFLIGAAQRHVIFNYNRIADYYAHASKEMQELMEDSALIILDFEKAIELGYAKLSDNLLQTFLDEPSKE